MSHHLQGHAVTAALAQLEHRFDSAQLALRFDIGVVAYRHGSISEADVERAFGACHDVIARHFCGEAAIRRRSAVECSAWIFDHPSCAGLVQVLMRVDQPRHDQLVAKIDSFLGREFASLGGERNDATICPDREVEPFRPFRAGSHYTTSRQKKGYGVQMSSCTVRFSRVPKMYTGARKIQPVVYEMRSQV